MFGQILISGLMLPIIELKLSDGSQKVKSVISATSLTKEFPVTIITEGEWKIFGEDESLICVGWGEKRCTTLTGPTDTLELTITLTTNKDKRTSEWWKKNPINRKETRQKIVRTQEQIEII